MLSPDHIFVIHCAATKNGRVLATRRESAAQRIDHMHKRVGFRRKRRNVRAHNSHLRHIGYHYVIDADGTLETGRAEYEQGAHVKGHNRGTVAVCMVGTDAFTIAQWATLRELVQARARDYPHMRLCGHRDFSPDLDGDGTIEPHEYIKICPGFNVNEWLDNDLEPLPEHIAPLSS